MAEAFPASSASASASGPKTPLQTIDTPSSPPIQHSDNNALDASRQLTVRTYKRRWFGLLQLTLLNIIVSWCWLTYAPVSTTSALFFETSIQSVNWFSTAFLFAFCVAAPFTIYALNHGPKTSIVVSSLLLLLGNWIRYGGAKATDARTAYGVTMFGQILCGFAQPFVLSAPTRYSDMWFTEKGRIGATAIATLANPLGGALGQLIDPFWATESGQIPNMVLYVAIISSVATVPSFFIPSRPPTPPTPTLSTEAAPALNLQGLRKLVTDPGFIVIAVPFTVLVSAFNAISSLLNDVLSPYGYSENAAGITGALLIFVGLASAAVTSPLLDRAPRATIPTIKVLVVVIAAMYLAFVWAPGTRSDAGPYAICAILGAASFSLLPVALELLVDIMWPVSPEVTSVIAWTGGQLGGALCIIIMDSLKGSIKGDEPPGNVKGGLIFLAILCWVAVPFPMVLGFWGLGERKRGVEQAERAPGDRRVWERLLLLRRSTDSN